MGGKLIAYSGFTCFVAGAVPWLCATLEALLQARVRGYRQGLIQAFFVFLVASPFGFAAFFVLNFCLQVTSFVKLGTGSVKGWGVTARGPAKPTAEAIVSSAKSVQVIGRKVTSEDAETNSGSDTASTADTDSSSPSAHSV